MKSIRKTTKREQQLRETLADLCREILKIEHGADPATLYQMARVAIKTWQLQTGSTK